jgi:hypothetical protein
MTIIKNTEVREKSMVDASLCNLSSLALSSYRYEYRRIISAGWHFLTSSGTVRYEYLVPYEYSRKKYVEYLFIIDLRTLGLTVPGSGTSTDKRALRYSTRTRQRTIGNLIPETIISLPVVTSRFVGGLSLSIVNNNINNTYMFNETRVIVSINSHYAAVE